jgi:hypothetical protein
MSLIKTYSPKSLWVSTLRLLNVIFRHPPAVSVDPVSYFQAVLDMHVFINEDLKGTLPVKCEADSSNPLAMLELIHSSLSALEKMLFGTSCPFEVSVEGCCRYTEHLEHTLSQSKNRCRLL